MQINTKFSPEDEVRIIHPYYSAYGKTFKINAIGIKSLRGVWCVFYRGEGDNITDIEFFEKELTLVRKAGEKGD